MGAHLREVRRQAGITQEQLSESLGITQSYVSEVERGKYPPSWKYLVGLANAAKINAVELLRRGGFLDDSTVALEQEMVALVQRVPEFAGIFEFAREHPEILPEMLRYGRWVAAGASEEEKSLATPKPRRRTAKADP